MRLVTRSVLRPSSLPRPHLFGP